MICIGFPIENTRVLGDLMINRVKPKKSKCAFDFFAYGCAFASHFTLRASFWTSPSALNAQSSLLSNALPLASKLANLAKCEPKN